MKCGRNIPDDQCFCESCLSDMEAYPIAIDTPFSIPHRASSSTVRKSQPRRKNLTEQEQIRRLKQRIRRLWSFIGVLLIALIVVGCLTANLVIRASRPRPGQNYTTSTVPISAAAPTSGSAS